MDESIIHMINPTGRVITIPAYKRRFLEAQGFHVIINAKEGYYPNYDKNNKGWNDPTIIENLAPGDFLEVEKL